MTSPILPAGDFNFTTSSLTLYYTITPVPPNPISHEPLIIHPPGWGVGIDLYKAAFAPLEASLQLIYLEPRGNSRSDCPATAAEISSRHQADDLEALRTHLALPHIHLFGHSASTSVGLAYAILYPNTIKNLILVAPYLLVHKRSPTQTKLLADVHARWEANPSQTDDEFRAWLIARLETGYLANPEKYVPVLAEIFHAAPPPRLATYQMWRAWDQQEYWRQEDDLGKITARVLIVNGAEDKRCFVEMGRAVRRGIGEGEGRSCRMVEMEGVGHFPWVEGPERFWREVRGLLEEGNEGNGKRRGE